MICCVNIRVIRFNLSIHLVHVLVKLTVIVFETDVYLKKEINNYNFIIELTLNHICTDISEYESCGNEYKNEVS